MSDHCCCTSRQERGRQAARSTKSSNAVAKTDFVARVGVSLPPGQVCQFKGAASELAALRTIRLRRGLTSARAGRDGVVLSQSSSGATPARPKSVVRIVISNVQRSADTGPGCNCTPRRNCATAGDQDARSLVTNRVSRLKSALPGVPDRAGYVDRGCGGAGTALRAHQQGRPRRR